MTTMSPAQATFWVASKRSVKNSRLHMGGVWASGHASLHSASLNINDHQSYDHYVARSGNFLGGIQAFSQKQQTTHGWGMGKWPRVPALCFPQHKRPPEL